MHLSIDIPAPGYRGWPGLVDWRKQKIGDLMMFFADFVIVSIKMIIDFKNFLSAFLDDHIVQLTSTSQRSEKVYFPLFWWCVLSKMRLWKINHCVNHAVPVQCTLDFLASLRSQSTSFKYCSILIFRVHQATLFHASSTKWMSKLLLKTVAFHTQC